MSRIVEWLGLCLLASGCGAGVDLVAPSFQVSPAQVYLAPVRYDQEASTYPVGQVGILNTSSFTVNVSQLQWSGPIAPFVEDVGVGVELELAPRESVVLNVYLLGPLAGRGGATWPDGRLDGALNFSVTGANVVDATGNVDLSRLVTVESSIVVSAAFECDFDGDGALALGCGGEDCDDNLSTVAPGTEEVCDGIDNNCIDGIKDEEC